MVQFTVTGGGGGRHNGQVQKKKREGAEGEGALNKFMDE